MRLTIIAMFLLTLVAGSAAIVGLQSGPVSQEERINRLIADLDSADFQTREQAKEELIRIGKPALKPLKAAMAINQTLEFKARAQQVLNTLAIFEDGGKVVNGLKIRLTADKAEVKPGEKIKLTTTLCNMTDEDMNVQVGYSTCGNYFQCGSVFHRVPQAGKPVRAQCRVGFCGTGAGPLFLTIPAKSVISYKAETTFAPQKGTGMGLNFGRNYFCLALPEQGKQRIRVNHQVTPAMNKSRGFGKINAGVRPANEQAKFWSGTIQSNEIELKVMQ